MGKGVLLAFSLPGQSLGAGRPSCGTTLPHSPAWDMIHASSVTPSLLSAAFLSWTTHTVWCTSCRS